MKEVSERHNAVFLAIMKLLTNNFSPEKISEIQYENLVNTLQNASTNEQQKVDEMRKIVPEMDDDLSELNRIADEFNTYINTCGITQDFNSYLKIEDLDR
jgi:predicted ATP-grasp superfamily ATP-dependent carboligase